MNESSFLSLYKEFDDPFTKVRKLQAVSTKVKTIM